MKDEKRFTLNADIEIRGDVPAPVLVGYPAKFNRKSQDLGGFVEKIAPGAFKKSLKKDDIRALFDHDSKFVLGRNKAGTLELEENGVGLKMTVHPPDTQWSRDLMESISRGDITQMSFGFRTIADSWEERDGKTPIRTLDEVDLFDVSVVTYPAYLDTQVGLRSLEMWRDTDSGEDEEVVRGDRCKPDLSRLDETIKIAKNS